MFTKRSSSMAPAMLNDQSDFGESRTNAMRRDLSSSALDKITIGRLDEPARLRSKSVLSNDYTEGDDCSVS